MKLMQRALTRWTRDCLAPRFSMWVAIVEDEKRIEKLQASTIKRMERQLHRWGIAGADRGFKAWRSFVVATRLEEEKSGLAEEHRRALFGRVCRRLKNLGLAGALTWWRYVVAETAAAGAQALDARLPGASV